MAEVHRTWSNRAYPKFAQHKRASRTVGNAQVRAHLCRCRFHCARRLALG